MLEKLFGSKTAERVMMFMYAYKEGYAKQISDNFDISVSMVQKQLDKFENAGFFVSFDMGNIRLYKWNKRNPFIKEIKQLLEKAFYYLPEEKKDKYYRKRKRPRKKNKSLNEEKE